MRRILSCLKAIKGLSRGTFDIVAQNRTLSKLKTLRGEEKGGYN